MKHYSHRKRIRRVLQAKALPCPCSLFALSLLCLFISITTSNIQNHDVNVVHAFPLFMLPARAPFTFKDTLLQNSNTDTDAYDAHTIPTPAPEPAPTQKEQQTATTTTTRKRKTYEILKEMHPLSPPMALLNLSIGESITPLPSSELSITRLSIDPPIFVMRNFLPDDDARQSLIHQATVQGMEYAGTSAGSHVAQRQHSFTSWIYPHTYASSEDYTGDNKDVNVHFDDDSLDKQQQQQQEEKAQIIAAYMTEVSRLLFVPDYLRVDHDDNNDDDDNQNKSKSRSRSRSSAMYDAEPLQIVKYDIHGKYDVHHDGLNRFMTVLTYLNGVAGTWFPYATTTATEADKEGRRRYGHDNVDDNNNEEEEIPDMKSGNIARNKVVGRDGLVVVSRDDDDTYRFSSEEETGNVVKVDAGDAIVFYNYDWIHNLEMDDATAATDDTEMTIPPTGPIMSWRSIHGGLQTTQEKWIATNWFYFHNDD